jgi:capsular exopolysaccharide synthesis family protein
MILCLAGTVAIDRLSTPRYGIATSVLIDNQNQNRAVTNNRFLQNLDLFANQSSFENELVVLKSVEIVNKAIKELQLFVSYYIKTQFIQEELYKNSPFVVVFDENHVQPVFEKFHIRFINANEFSIEMNSKTVKLYDFKNDKIVGLKSELTFSKKYKVGDNIKGNEFAFTILPNPGHKLSDYINKDMYFNFNSIYDLTMSYQAKVNVEAAAQNTTIANISFNSSNIQKGVDFLNELTNQYIIQSLERKNHLATKTIDYIDKQLYEISDSLNFAERRLQNFRIERQVMNIGEKSGQMFQQLQNLENERSTTLIKKKYYEYIIDYFNQNKEYTDILIPSSMGVEDQLLTQLIQQIIQLSNDKNKLISNNQQRSPYYTEITNNIENIKKTISDNLKYGLNAIDLTLNSLNQRIDKYQAEVNKLPVTERELVGIERKYNLSNAIYTFLLERRAESQIAKASNLPSCQVVDPAKYVGKTFPDNRINFILAVFLGLFLPGGMLVLKNMMNDKIMGSQDIEKVTDIPILGQVFHNYRKQDTVFADYPKSAIAESFRTIRTNLDYFRQGQTKSTFLVTSTVGQEGKSFTSLNLALCFASNDRKTLLVEMDLRKPTLYQKLSLQNFVGVTSYLIDKAVIDDIIIETVYPNLYFIASGPLPPNPSELLASEKTSKFIQRLKNDFDIIIIDTPPIGIVTDSLLLMHQADVKIYIVRQNKTIKSDFAASIKDIEKKEINNMSILVNDVMYDKGKGKYGYGYYLEKGKKTKKTKNTKKA